jgi:hypothetical protein
MQLFFSCARKSDELCFATGISLDPVLGNDTLGKTCQLQRSKTS